MYIYSDTLLGKACDFLRVCEEKLLSRRLKDVVNLPGITWMQITRGHQATFYPPTHPVSDHSLAVIGCSILVGRPSWTTTSPTRPWLWLVRDVTRTVTRTTILNHHQPYTALAVASARYYSGKRPWGDHPWNTTSSTRPDAMTGKTRSNEFSRSQPADKIRAFSRFC